MLPFSHVSLTAARRRSHWGKCRISSERTLTSRGGARQFDSSAGRCTVALTRARGAALRYRMAADHIGGSRDIGTLVHGERQVLEMIATGAPLASVLDVLCRVIDERSELMSAVFLLDDRGKHLTYVVGPHLPA